MYVWMMPFSLLYVYSCNSKTHNPLVLCYSISFLSQQLPPGKARRIWIPSISPENPPRMDSVDLPSKKMKRLTKK